MKKYIILLIGVALGIIIGVVIVVLCHDFPSNSDDNYTVVTKKNAIESNYSISKKETSRVVNNKKVAEELNEIFSNSYYRTQWLEFQKHGKQINERAFKVFYVACDGQAYVRGRDEFGGYNGQVYYLIDEKSADLYDDQIITVPKRKVVKRYGTIDYRVRPMTYKKVPRIMIMDAN